MSATAIHERLGSESFRFVLRRATRVEHQSLDDHPAFAALIGGTLGIGGYRTLMSLFHGFYAAHDSILADACNEHRLERSGFIYAPRADMLAEDMSCLGAKPPVPVASIPGPHRLAIGSAGSLAGMLYVFEGSMLGGSVLCRAVEALLAAHGASGARYWRWCRDAGAARWAMTCAMLDEVSATSRARADMVDGARAAFSGFSDWFSDWADEACAEPTPVGSLDRC